MGLFNKKQPVPQPAAQTGTPAVPSTQPTAASSVKATKSSTPQANGIQKLEKGMMSLVDLIAPSSVEVDFRYIRVGEKFYSTLFIVG